MVSLLGVTLTVTPDQADAVRKPANLKNDWMSYDPDLITQVSLQLPPQIESTLVPTPSDPVETQNQTSVVVKSGDTLARIFAKLGLSARTLHRIVHRNPQAERLKKLHPGDQLHFNIGENNELKSVRLELDQTHSILVTQKDDASFEINHSRKPVEIRTAFASGEITESLFLAGQRAGLSDSMTMELAAIFGWDVDFSLDIRQGDRFTILFEERYLEDKKIGNGPILAAEFVNQGKTYQAIRHPDKDGIQRYFTPKGLSMRKSFLRSPVSFSRISSGFSLRRKHPVLNRIRAHKGVDYAARTGTPVRATGDGKVEFKGKKGGYGNTIVLRHGNRYTTLYAHLSGYKRKLRAGQRVRQGQIIGYVGSTGLASGPHLHYEFRIHGVHRNPLTVKLPAAKPIDKDLRQDFLAYAEPRIAQLDILNRSLAAKHTPLEVTQH